MVDQKAAATQPKLRDGKFLLIRQVIGLIISVVGMLALTRLLGPTVYGVYASAFGIMFFAQTVSEFSLDIYLVRYPGTLPENVCHQVFLLLIGSAFAITLLLIAGTKMIAEYLGFSGFADVAVLLFASVPLMHLQQVPLALLERDFRYKSIGIIEILGQIAFYAVSLPFALHYGARAAAAGWFVQQALLLAGYSCASRYRPRISWDSAQLPKILGFGATTTVATLAYALRNLVNPLFVGATLGPAAVGYIALALRILDQVGFLRTVIARLSVRLFATVSSEPNRLKWVLTQAIEAQVLAVGVPLSIFCLIAPYLIPIVFGPVWGPTVPLLSILVLPYIAAAAFALIGSAMMTRDHPWILIISNAANMAVFVALCLLLIPAFGLLGFAYADLIAVASWVVGDFLYSRQFIRPQYAVASLWLIALGGIAMAHATGGWTLILAAPALLLPRSISEAAKIVRLVLHSSQP